MTAYQRKKCPRNTCLPCDARRRKGPSLSAGALLAVGGLRRRECPIHGDRIEPGSEEDRVFEERSIKPRGAPPADPLPPPVALERPRLRAKPEALEARRRELAAGDDPAMRRNVLALWIDA